MLQSSKNKKDFSVVGILFILTGIAIVVYLNQTPLQPRERDYAYAGSFYAFTIWIGLGVLGIIDIIGKKAKNIPVVVIVTIACLVLVPGIMAKENWDDHDRSGRYTARDIAYNYLNSCAPNAILFTGGDNDTFPLWYAQEVEGIRTDVRVVNLMLLNMDWYIDQMKRKVYDSEAVPILIESEKYRNGTRDAIPIYERTDQSYDAKDIIDFIISDLRSTKLPAQSGGELDYVPTRAFYLPVDSARVVNNGTVNPINTNQIVKTVNGRITASYLTKSNLAALDLLRNNNWERPIYYVGTNQTDELGLSDYLQLDGLAYRFVPIKTPKVTSFEKGRIEAEILYNNLMNNFLYRGMNDEDVYFDTFHRRTLSVIRIRFRFMRLANKLIEAGDTGRAELVLDRIIEILPDKNLPYDMFMPGIAETYYKISKFEKGTAIQEKMIDISQRHLEYYSTFSKRQLKRINMEVTYHMRVLANSVQLAREYNQTDLALKAEELFNKFGKTFSIMQ